MSGSSLQRYKILKHYSTIIIFIDKNFYEVKNNIINILQNYLKKNNSFQGFVYLYISR